MKEPEPEPEPQPEPEPELVLQPEQPVYDWNPEELAQQAAVLKHLLVRALLCALGLVGRLALHRRRPAVRGRVRFRVSFSFSFLNTMTLVILDLDL